MCHTTYVTDGGAVKKSDIKQGEAAGACDEEGTINNNSVVNAQLAH